MESIHRNLVCVLSLISLTLYSVKSVDAQSGRFVDSNLITGGCFESGVTGISTFPPLHTDMSLDCLLGYIYMDSLCSHDLSFAQIDSLTNLLSLGDSLKLLSRFFYAMTDYDPILCKEYIMNAFDLDSSYRTRPGIVLHAFKEKFESLFGTKSKQRLILNSSYILHIKVKDIYSSEDTFAHSPIHPLPLRCISAEILNPIKGKRVIPCLQEGSLNHKKQTTQTISNCMNFIFSPVWEKEAPRRTVDIIVNDSSYVLPCDNCYGPSAVIDETEYIVFLDVILYDFDGTTAYYNSWPMAGYSPEGGILKIQNGEVKIPSNYLGYGTSVPLSTFLASLQVDIDSITDY